MTGNKGGVMDFADLMREHDAELFAKAQADIAVEDAAYRALPQAERDRLAAEYEAKCEALDAELAAAIDHGVCPGCDEELDESEADDGICYDCQNGGAA